MLSVSCTWPWLTHIHSRLPTCKEKPASRSCAGVKKWARRLSSGCAPSCPAEQPKLRSSLPVKLRFNGVSMVPGLRNSVGVKPECSHCSRRKTRGTVLADMVRSVPSHRSDHEELGVELLVQQKVSQRATLRSAAQAGTTKSPTQVDARQLDSRIHVSA